MVLSSAFIYTLKRAVEALGDRAIGRLCLHPAFRFGPLIEIVACGRGPPLPTPRSAGKVGTPFMIFLISTGNPSS